MCVALGAQVTKFQFSEVVGENKWKSLGKAGTKNTSGIMHEEY